MKKSFLLAIFAAAMLMLTGCSEPKTYELRVATFNIRNANPGDSVRGDGWHQRAPVITDLVRFHDFEIFGMQEVIHLQLMGMLDAMPEYDYIGVGRTDGGTKGEYVPVFYKKAMFELLDSGNFWIAEDTTVPNKGWDASLNRICTWGKFGVRENGFVFWLFNIHMDHRGVEARREGSKLILSKIKEMCGGDQVILMGDFNVDQGNESYTLINTSGILQDAYEKAEMRYAYNGTFNNFNPHSWTESRIDHIFVTAGFTVDRYGILTDSYRYAPELSNETSGGNFPDEVVYGEKQARMPSDHFPVMVILEYMK